MTEKPRPKTSLAEKELDKAEKQFDAFDQEVKSMTLDRMNVSSRKEEEQQTKIANQDIDKMKDIYLKPKRSLLSSGKFNEKFRDSYNFDKEYVHFIAENKEIIGESITMWTHPYPGVNCEEWDIPVNKPIWAPRYVAEKLKSKFYHRLKMEDKSTSSDGFTQYYGTIAVDTTIQRLDAHPVTKKRSIFMGANNF